MQNDLMNQEAGSAARITTRGNTVITANDKFLELSGYLEEDIIDKNIEDVWNRLLRLTGNIRVLDSGSEEIESFLFTKSLEPKEVTITMGIEEDHVKIFTFDAKHRSGIEDKFPYIHRLCESPVQGVAVFAITPNIVLLQANQTFLSFLDVPFDSKENSIGKRIDEFITGWKGSTSEQIWKKALDTGEYLYLDEYRYDGFERGVTYWKTTLMPIYENEVIKYAIEVTEDITEAVLNKQRIKEQARIIKEQNMELEAIIQNMSDVVYIIDKDENMYLVNEEAKIRFVGQTIDKLSDGFKNTKYYYLDGKEVPYDEMPGIKALKGEKVNNCKMIIRQPDKEYISEISAVPIFDESDNISKVIIFSHDITDLMKKERFLKEQQELLLKKGIKEREALEAAIKLKDEFVYLITHEFRTPMAVINSALQAIELMYKNEVTANIGKHLNTINQNTNRQIRLVNNLLDITKISSGNIKLNKNIFDIVYLTKAIVNSVEIYAKQKSVNISFKSSVSKKEIFLDEEKYERILLNLLANALKFTPKHKDIQVSIFMKKRKGRDRVCISVSDEGIGIPKDKQHIVFERFGQADTSLSRQAEGTGLGLYLVKLLIDALDGEITLESEVGKGATFTVILPVMGAQALDEVAASAEISHQLSQTDERLVQSVAIEFSDIYF